MIRPDGSHQPGIAYLLTRPDGRIAADADTLDGLHAAAFALSGHNHDAVYAALSHNHDHGALTGRGDDDHTQYLLASGARALSGAWDAGGYQIRALQFYADVASGTAPLIVASTTRVANLNADLLDGSHASAFAAASHTHDSRYYTESESDARYAPIAKGVTNGDSHNHYGGDGAQIDHGTLAGLGDNDHPQYSLTSHTHDNRYYTETESNNNFAAKSHSHKGIVYAYTSAKTSTSWDGDSKGVGSYTIDTSAWGVPTGVPGVFIRLAARWGSANANYACWARCYGVSDAYAAVLCRSMVGGYWNENSGFVPCDGNGDFTIVVTGATCEVYLTILGYLTVY